MRPRDAAHQNRHTVSCRWPACGIGGYPSLHSNWLAANPTPCQIGTKGLNRRVRARARQRGRCHPRLAPRTPPHRDTGSAHVQFCHRSPVIQPEPCEQCRCSSRFRECSLYRTISHLNENGSLQRLGMALMSVSAVEWCGVWSPWVRGRLYSAHRHQNRRKRGIAQHTQPQTTPCVLL